MLAGCTSSGNSPARHRRPIGRQARHADLASQSQRGVARPTGRQPKATRCRCGSAAPLALAGAQAAVGAQHCAQPDRHRPQALEKAARLLAVRPGPGHDHEAASEATTLTALQAAMYRRPRSICAMHRGSKRRARPVAIRIPVSCSSSLVRALMLSTSSARPRRSGLRQSFVAAWQRGRRAGATRTSAGAGTGGARQYARPGLERSRSERGLLQASPASRCDCLIIGRHAVCPVHDAVELLSWWIAAARRQ